MAVALFPLVADSLPGRSSLSSRSFENNAIIEVALPISQAKLIVLAPVGGRVKLESANPTDAYIPPTLRRKGSKSLNLSIGTRTVFDRLLGRDQQMTLSCEALRFSSRHVTKLLMSFVLYI